METNQEILSRAYKSWLNAGYMRSVRERNKKFVFGDQWSDVIRDKEGTEMTDGMRFLLNGTQPITNNLLGQLVRSVVGRYRHDIIQSNKGPAKRKLNDYLNLDELDARLFEEFLISGIAIQKITHSDNASVSNVNFNDFIISSVENPNLVGQLHDMTMAEILIAFAHDDRKRAKYLQDCYSGLNAVAEFSTAIGADDTKGHNFWYSHDKMRVIEVWTHDAYEALVFDDNGNKQIVPISNYKLINYYRRKKLTSYWKVVREWNCRYFSPCGKILDIIHSTTHPFVTLFYPCIDGEIHSFVESSIDGQKYINRLVSTLNRAMESSAKGVLLFPETALPDGYTWKDVRKAWSNAGGILPYDPRESDARPQQIINNGTNIGAYEMINLQMKLMEQVSGVSGAFQGRTGLGGNSAKLYEAQSINSSISLTDIFDTFTNFRNRRNQLL